MLLRVDVGALAQALNDTIMVFAFAPIVALLLGLSSIAVPWATLVTSVGLYIVIPVVLAQLWRRALLRGGQAALDATLARIVNSSKGWYQDGQRTLPTQPDLQHEQRP